MTEEEKKKARLKAIRDKFMIGEAKVDKIKTHMGGKTPRGFTEHVKDDKMVSTPIEEFVRKQQERRMIKDIEGDAIRERADMARRKARRAALKGMGSKAGKLLGKIPALGSLLGPAATLALTGNPNEALASALDSEDLGEGSDVIEDMGLSRAERLMAERRALEAMKKRGE